MLSHGGNIIYILDINISLKQLHVHIVINSMKVNQ